MIRGGGTAKQIIDLPGAKVDTLYTTVESGINENGIEWEKRQMTAPRTFEEAIIDKDRVPLSKKIADILEKINQLNGGEYDTLVAEIAALKKEVDELDLTQWDYQVPNTVSLLFRGTSETKDVALNMYASDDFVLQNAATGNDFVQLLSDRDRLRFLLETTFARTVTVTSNQEIIFGSDDRESKFRMFAAGNGYRFQVKPTESELWDTKIYIDKDKIYTYLPVEFAFSLLIQGISINKGNTGQLLSETGFVMKGSSTAAGEKISPSAPCFKIGDLGAVHYISVNNAGQMCFCSDFQAQSIDRFTNCYIDPYGGWHFTNPITAPNLVSKTSVVLAEQGITEQDLQMIGAQQEITEHELDYIVTQQIMTEMDLERLEGENGHE